jgi:small-conductance mechanosensitive channel
MGRNTNVSRVLRRYRNPGAESATIAAHLVKARMCIIRNSKLTTRTSIIYTVKEEIMNTLNVVLTAINLGIMLSGRGTPFNAIAAVVGTIAVVVGL